MGGLVDVVLVCQLGTVGFLVAVGLLVVTPPKKENYSLVRRKVRMIYRKAVSRISLRSANRSCLSVCSSEDLQRNIASSVRPKCIDSRRCNCMDPEREYQVRIFVRNAESPPFQAE